MRHYQRIALGVLDFFERYGEAPDEDEALVIVDEARIPLFAKERRERERFRTKLSMSFIAENDVHGFKFTEEVFKMADEVRRLRRLLEHISLEPGWEKIRLREEGE